MPDFGDQITIRRLIHHTSGLPDQSDLLELAGWRELLDLVTMRTSGRWLPASVFPTC